MAKNGFKISNCTKTIVLIVLLIIVSSFLYFPSLLTGKALDAHDLQAYKGMSKELADYRDKTGEEALWTNSMFGGMPAYLISAKYKGNVTTVITSILNVVPRPANYLIISISLFFLLGMILGASPWISFAGGLAYGFATFIFILVDAGHMTKVLTLSYFSLLIAGIYLAYNKKAIPGSLITALGLSLMLNANHPQMTYYAGIMVLIIGITYLIFAIKEKQIAEFLKSTGFLVAAAVLAVGMNSGPLLTTLEYGKYSTRGQSDLAEKSNNQTDGLDRDYILDYSYDVGEALTAFIPRFKGGGMSEPLGESSAVYKMIEKSQGKANAKEFTKTMPLYWGSQPIAGGTFYYGAVLCFLFVLGLFIVRGKEKYWIAAVVVVSFLLSLGKNIPFLANFMIDSFPGYSKFRDVKNIIVIQQFAMAVLGLLAVKEVYLRNIDSKKFINSLKYAFGITGGLALIFVLIPGLAGNFQGNSDAQLVQGGWPKEFIDALISDRKSILRMDSLRSFIFVALAAAGLWAFWTKKIKGWHALALWVLLILADMWPINKKYLNSEDFVSKRKTEVPFTPSKADEIILADKDPDYRVLNIGLSTFNDGSTSYFHKSIGGYHGAKMKRYQELIENGISKEIQEIAARFKNIKTQEDLDGVMAGLNSLNMLNTRYLIYNQGAAPIKNPNSMGNAWFVENCKIAANANEELESVSKIDIANTAVVDKQFSNLVSGKSFKIDPSAEISLKSYAPNKLVYSSSSNSEQLAVFSEIYYPKGWIASIDGKEAPYFRANYVLRSMVIPAGSHEIVFEFKPATYKKGNNIAFASSALLLLAFGGFIFLEYKKRSNESTHA